jgi:hypothetical protein
MYRESPLPLLLPTIEWGYMGVCGHFMEKAGKQGNATMGQNQKENFINNRRRQRM